jgi:4-alpha-glucanotransferase
MPGPRYTLAVMAERERPAVVRAANRPPRGCGVLLHVTCLPGRWGIGDLGPEAFRYVEWLAAAGVSTWQFLPLNPPGAGHAPYSATSSFAGNPLLVSPDRLLADGLLCPTDLADAPTLPEFAVDFAAVATFKRRLLGRAWERFAAAPPPGVAPAFEAFRAAEAEWLDDAALFAALAAANGTATWRRWPKPLALHDAGALAAWRAAHADAVTFHAFVQFLFSRQFDALRAHARQHGVRLFGDVPIFVPLDSADVWARRELFRLDASGAPTVVAGVPPDYFSASGQLWGHPHYDWPRHAADGYRWWIARLRQALRLADLVRLDHFRGFAASWEVPAGKTTAVDGRWAPGPGRDLFDAVRAALGGLPLVAEDLGVITPDVEELRDSLGLPGMAILQFAFAPDGSSSFVPHALRRHQVVYTGTHDNDTTLGWWLGDASDAERDFARRYMATDGREIHWDLIRLALGSVADLAVVPHQDLAGLGSDCRMNTPGVAEGNWRFRITPWMLGDAIRDRLADLIRVYGRRPR